MAAYRAALEERTRDRVPLDWAMTQTNLGNAAGEAWRALDWAMTLGTPVEQEVALERLAADEGEPQEVEGFRLAEPAP